MTELAFHVLDAVPEKFAAAPHLLFRMRVNETSGAVVHAIALRCQLRVEPQRRLYDGREQEALADLFGTPDRYAATLKPFLWTHATALVQGFEREREFDLPVACTYDFDVSATKYIHALQGGEIPVVLLFSGTVFTRGGSGFAAEQLSWSLQAQHRLPVSVWHELMDIYFPGSGWIRLDRETIAALNRYRTAQGLTSWEETFGALLPDVLEVGR